MSRRGAGQQRQLVTPLAEAEEQRQQDRADEQPLAHRHRDRGGSRGGAEDEADRNRQHIENHDVLEHARVPGEQAEVRRGNQAERRPDPERRPIAAAPITTRRAERRRPAQPRPRRSAGVASADAADRPRGPSTSLIR